MPNAQKIEKNKIQKVIFISGIIFIVLAGSFVTLDTKKKAEIRERDELMKISDVASAAINPRRLVTLEGSEKDLQNPDYQRLKEQLVLINESLKTFGTQWIYLMEKKEGKWIFSVDPLWESSPDYTAPGTVYENYPQELDLVLEKKETVSVGPYKDQWGEFISGFSPIKDLETGEILGVLGVDIDADLWKDNVQKSQILPLSTSFFILVLWILFFGYRSRKIRHEKDIKSREERFKSITETISDIIYRINSKNEISYISPAVEKILGFSREEILGRNFLELVYPSDYSKAKDAVKKVFQGEDIDSFELLLNCRNGGMIQADLNVASIQEEGKVVEIQGVIRDVTQKKSSEEKIKKQNEELEKSQTAMLNILQDIKEEKENVSKEKEKIDAILHSIGDGVFVVDRELKIIMVNHVTCQISGYSEEELIGKKYSEKLKFIFEKDGSENREFIREAMRTGEVKEMSNHTLLIRKDEKRVSVADSAAPLKDKEGDVVGCVVVFRDVTKEREIDQMKSEFVSVASHQLRTPLTGIKWFSELLLENKEKKLSKEQREFISEIYNNNERMISLVNDLLNVSRIETGKNFKIAKEETDVMPIIKGIIKDQELIAKNKKIEIICEGDCLNKMIIKIDGEKIRQVFQNLVSNAIKYSPENSRIFWGHKDEKEKIIFFVKDSGLGIPLDQQKEIFDKFFRASNVLMTGTEGTGLGLYIAKSIVEAHGGKIWFESKEKEGTTFFLELPK